MNLWWWVLIAGLYIVFFSGVLGYILKDEKSSHDQPRDDFPWDDES